MAIGVARAAEAIVASGCACLLLIALLRPAPARADDAAAPPALSPVCEAPAADIASPEPLPRLRAALDGRTSIRVLTIGSSVAATRPARQIYPSRFEDIMERAFKGLDVVVVNRGVSGEVAALTAERLKAQVALERPQLVLWQVGTNDALARVPVDSFAGTLRDTLRWLKQNGVDVVLVGLQYAPKVVREEYFGGIRVALRDVALAENVLLVRRADAMEFIEKARLGVPATPDQAGLGDLGSRCLAEHVARAVVVSAFLDKRRVASP